jgi:hypothetical protein
VSARKRNLFHDKLEENYENIGDFMKRSLAPVSMETVRRLVTEGKPVNTTSLIMVAKYLGFTNEEIRDILLSPGDYILKDAKDLRYAADFVSLMGYGAEALTEHDKIVLDAFRNIRKENPPIFNTLVQCMIYICGHEGIECSGLALLIHPHPPAPEDPPTKKKRR